MGIEGISTIGQISAYADLLSNTGNSASKIDVNDPNSFERVINQVLVDQLTSNLFSGSFFGAASEYSYFMQDMFSSVFADQLKIIDYGNSGGKV